MDFLVVIFLIAIASIYNQLFAQKAPKIIQQVSAGNKQQRREISEAPPSAVNLLNLHEEGAFTFYIKELGLR